MKKRWIAIAMLAVLLMGIGGAIGKVLPIQNLE